MSSSPFSSSWYRVAELKPLLRTHTEIHRQQFRGEIWYVIQDHASGRFHRFTPAAYLVISLMDGTHTVQEIWETAAERLGDDLPSQDEMIQLLAQMYSADMLNADVATDMAELTERSEKIRQKAGLWQKFKNPLAIRIPLIDPDRFLTATLPFVRVIFSWGGFAIWLGVVVLAIVLAGEHWSALTENVIDRVLSTNNLLMLVVVYPVVKGLHELGHAYAVKIWGGEVHEFGILFLLMMPVPYVDASASSAFREKRRRAIVAAAGIGVEIFIAALALFVWISIEPGTIRAMAYNAMLTAGISTLLFNGNPLLRFDGYYVFSDLIEIPNLGSRANKYIMYLVQRHLYGLTDPPPPAAPGERPWFVIYGISAFIYRMSMMTGIVMLVAMKFFAVGILLALWAAFNMFVLPVIKGLLFVLHSEKLRAKRRRAVIATSGVIAVVLGFLLLVPFPHATTTEGVVWSPEGSRIHAPVDGFFVKVLAVVNQTTQRGQPVIKLEDPLLKYQVRILEAELKEAELRYVVARTTDLVQADVMGEKVKHIRAKLMLEQKRVRDLTLLSPADGTFILPKGADSYGRFVKKGELLGFVIDYKTPIVRVVASQADIDLIRQKTRSVRVRFVSRVLQVNDAVIIREVPAATNQLPSMALSTSGGGKINLDPSDTKGARTFERYFQFDIGFTGTVPKTNIGERAYVRFDHGYEALAFRLYRSLRQILLRNFDV